jgi:hypothetical protein
MYQVFSRGQARQRCAQDVWHLWRMEESCDSTFSPKPAGTPWYCWSGPIGTAHEKGSSWVLGQISSLDWYKIIWPYKLHQFARFGIQLAAIPFM